MPLPLSDVNAFRFNPSSSGCGWKTKGQGNHIGAHSAFQSFFFWMWLENQGTSHGTQTTSTVSILLLLDVAGKRSVQCTAQILPGLFQSFFFWMWLENSEWGQQLGGAYRFQSFFFRMWLENRARKDYELRGEHVSILLLLDVAGKLGFCVVFHMNTICFNPSSSGCGWKTRYWNGCGYRTGWFQSFFFWMWLENMFNATNI